MFVQVIQGRANDRDGLKQMFARWYQDLAPGAEGWLGSTAGVTDDGRFIASARFESQEAARANSEREEQDAWWRKTEQLLGDHWFHDCTEVDTYKASGSDEAGFVQVIQARLTDKAEYRERLKHMESQHPRDDVIGGIIAWDGNHFTEVVYFTSEREARVAEGRPEKDIGLELRWSLSTDPIYFDLRDPWLFSPAP